MLNFVDIKVADNFENYTKEEKEKTTLDELMTVANAIREVRTTVEKSNVLSFLCTSTGRK